MQRPCVESEMSARIAPRCASQRCTQMSGGVWSTKAATIKMARHSILREGQRMSMRRLVGALTLMTVSVISGCSDSSSPSHSGGEQARFSVRAVNADYDDRPVSGAHVVARHPSGRIYLDVLTDAEGYTVLSKPAPFAPYYIAISRDSCGACLDTFMLQTSEDQYWTAEMRCGHNPPPADQQTVSVYDQAPPYLPIAEATVKLYLAGTQVGISSTNPAGVAVFLRLSATHQVIVSKTGYVDSAPTDFTPGEDVSVYLRRSETAANTRIELRDGSTGVPVYGVHIVVDSPRDEFDHDLVLGSDENLFPFYLEGSAQCTVSRDGYETQQYIMEGGDSWLVNLCPPGGCIGLRASDRR
jgi:hypothetical protein